MMKKGQAAMEYLMTYGWAILIIVVVVAALYAMGVFKQKAAIPYSGFGGELAYVDHNSTHLILKAGRDLVYQGTTYSAGDSITINISGTCDWSTQTSCDISLTYTPVGGTLKTSTGTLYKTW